MGNMDTIGRVIQNIFKRSRFSKKIKEANIFLNYRDIVGDKIANVSRPTSIKNEILFIGVENSAWAQQLHFFKPEILEKLNSSNSYPVIKDIRFHICSIVKENGAFVKEMVEKPEKPKIPDKTIKMIYNISSKVKDDKLREKFTKFMIKDTEYKLKKRCK